MDKCISGLKQTTHIFHSTSNGKWQVSLLKQNKASLRKITRRPLGIWPSGARENSLPFGRGSNPLCPPQTVCVV